jgi:tetratricopeptide (TPR) repeat protein
MSVSILLVLAGLAGQSAPATAPTAEALGDAYYYFLQARTLQDADNAAAAIEPMRKAIAIVPDSADLHAELAGLYAAESRAADSAAAAEAALRLDPTHRNAHRILGLVQAAVARNVRSGPEARSLIAEAVGHLEQALAGNVRDLAVELRLGEVYLMHGDPASAITMLERFLEQQPGYVDAELILAQAYAAGDRIDAAVTLLEDLVRRRPDQPEVGVSLAEMYEQSDRWRDAAGAWAALAERDDAGATSFTLRQATALANAGDIAGARSLLLRVTNEAPGGVSAWYLLAQVELRSGNADAAEASARHILRLAPADPRGPLTLADVFLARGDFDAVVTTLEPRVSAPLDDDLRTGVHGRLAVALAAAYQERGEPGDAVEVLEAARARVPADDELLYNLGAAYERDERFDAAEAALRDLIARVPGHARALNYLGYMLADRDQKLGEAVTLIERALQLEPGNPSFLDSLGWAYFKQGRFDDARGPLEQAAARMATVSLVQEHLGDVYFQLKLYREAAAAYDRALAGDLAEVSASTVTRKRNRARELAGQ